jgi:rhomboid protease GluP
VGEDLSFREDFLFWKLAHLLISEHGYRLLQISKSEKEIWLENMESKDNQVIRILLHPLDWSNWLQRDIQLTLANAESVRRQLKKRTIHVFTIYITQYPPVDEYEFRIEKPAIHSKGDQTKVTSVIVDRNNGVQTIENALDTSLHLNLKEEYEEAEIEREKQATLFAVKEKVKSEKALLNNGKPIFTYIFIAIVLIVFVLMEIAGGSTNTATLIDFGAKVNWLILQGEWWRLFTPIFIHIGILHLAMNTLSLYYLGMIVERIYGNFRFLFIYLIAGFFGTLASLLFSTNISAGASGAIFGCLGALLYFGTSYPKLFKRTMGANILLVIVINLLFGFSVSGIDNAGHIGGLVGGFLAAAIVHLPKSKRVLFQVSALIVSVVLVFGSFQFSLANRGKLLDEQTALVLSQNYLQGEEYDEAYKLLNEYNSQNGSTVHTLFQLSFSELKTGRIQKAKEHLHEIIETDPGFHEALYNLSIIYVSEDNMAKAKEYATQALEEQPSNPDYQNLLKEITNLESGGSSALGA